MKLTGLTKKIIAGVTAVALCTGAIATTVVLNHVEAEAKETFQGITELVDKNSESSPLNVVELVPGTAKYSFTDELEGEKEFDISLGDLAYTIGGSEPTNFAGHEGVNNEEAVEGVLANFSSSKDRKAFVEKYAKLNADGTAEGTLYNPNSISYYDWYSALKTGTDTAAVSAVPYEEIYAPSQEDIVQGYVDNNPWTKIVMSATRETLAYGKKIVSNPEGLGQLLKKLSLSKNVNPFPDSYPDERLFVLVDNNSISCNTVSKNSIDTVSYNKVLSETGDNTGDCDPAVKFVPGSEGRYNVIFEPVAQSGRGYHIVRTEEAHPDTDIVPDETILYATNSQGLLVYAGTKAHPLSANDINDAYDLATSGEPEEAYIDEDADDIVIIDDAIEIRDDAEDVIIDDEPEGTVDVGEEEGISIVAPDEDANPETPVVDETPADDETITDDTPTGDETPADDETPAGDDIPASEETPADDAAPVEEGESVGDQARGGMKVTSFLRMFDSFAAAPGQEDYDIENQSGAGSDNDADSDAHDGKDEDKPDADTNTTPENTPGEGGESGVTPNGESTPEGGESTPNEDQAETEVTEEVTEEEEAEIVEEEPAVDIVSADGELTYYYVEFAYDMYGQGETVYAIKSMIANNDGAANNAYDVEDILVRPNFFSKGFYLSEDDPAFSDYFCYEYAHDEEKDTFYGNFDMTSEGADPDTDCIRMVNVPIYYRGGFKNNEWFRRSVLDRVDEAGNLNQQVYINANTVTPHELSSGYEISQVDLLYLTAGSDLFLPEPLDTTHTDPKDTMPKYSADNDISEEMLKDIYMAVVEDNLAVILDSRLLGTAYNGTNIQKLAILLEQQDLDIFYTANGQKSPHDFANSTMPTQYFAKGTKAETHHVNRSVYVVWFGTITTTTMRDATISKETLDYGFQEVYEMIDNENMYREVNGIDGRIPREISEAVAIKYILSYGDRKKAMVKDEIHVLELQAWTPEGENTKKKVGELYVQENKGSATTTYSLMRKGATKNNTLLADFKQPIYLHSMTTSELGAHMSELCDDYDLIYLGLSTGYFNTKDDGRTNFNDNTMDGLIYTNIGDTVHYSGVYGGLLDTERDGDVPKHETGDYAPTARYSGDDITRNSVDVLKRYIDSGFPMILDYNCIYGNDDSPKVYDKDSSGNNGYIDNCSYLYEFLNYAVKKHGINGKGSQNVKDLFRLNSAGDLPDYAQTYLNFYLNLPKPEIVLDESVVRTDVCQWVDDRDAANNNYYMEYEFVIRDYRSTDKSETYDCKLYLDSNSDAKYAASEECNPLVIETLGGERMYKSGNHYKLKAGVDYQLRYRVPDDITGGLAWKLEVELNGDGERSDSVTGCYQIHRRGAPKETISILQIMDDDYDGTKNYDDNRMCLTERADGWKTNVMDYLNDTSHYTANVDIKTSIEFSDMVKAEGMDVMKHYSVLVLGFTKHGYQILSDSPKARASRDIQDLKNAEKVIQQYIASGGGVLVGQSLMNPTNSAGVANWSGDSNSTYGQGSAGCAPWNWTPHKWLHMGYNQTQSLRSLIGQDRYGVTEKTDSGIPGGNIGDVLKKGEVVWGASSLDSRNSNRHSYAYWPNSGKKDAIPEVQGYSTIFLEYTKIRGNGWPAQQWLYGGENQVAWGNYDWRNNAGSLPLQNAHGFIDDPTVSVLNKGKMTMYPYPVADTFKVAQTSIPVYATDMDSDGGVDTGSMTVWYAFTKGDKAACWSYEHDLMNPRDHYFMYTKGNVTYLGMELLDYEGSYNTTAALMANCLINAYSAGSNVPYVHIVDDEINRADIDSIVLHYDDFGVDDKPVNYDQTIPVNYFSIGTKTNVDLVSNYYYTYDGIAAGDPDVVEIGGVLMKKFTPVSVIDTTTGTALAVTAAPNTNGQVTGYPTKNNIVYTLEVPITFMEGHDAIQVYCVVTAVNPIKKDNGDLLSYSAVDGYDKVSLVRSQLFNLD